MPKALAQVQIFHIVGPSTGCHYVVALTSPHPLDGGLRCSQEDISVNTTVQAAADKVWLNIVPRLMTAQAIRASLLATATVTTRAGRLASSALIQPAILGLFRE